MAQLGKPPVLSAVPVILEPVPFSASFLANSRERAIANGTFQLNTSTTPDLEPGESMVMPLHLLPTANSVILSIEAAEGAAEGAVLARLWQDGTYPTINEGLPLKDGGVIEIQGSLNIQNTRIISADDKAHTIQVQYFS
ncbi:MAG: hypothetical protein H7Y13_02295 [Sphingobacteriaceae bacterium]|nr:hypothetical protein [Sphingobacteriaceae bacterium]